MEQVQFSQMICLQPAVTFEHSINEARYMTFGLSSERCVLALSHTDRGGVVRIVSARAATRREKQIYEES